MLIKIGNKWLDASAVKGLSFFYNVSRHIERYVLCADVDKDNYLCGHYSTKEGVTKAMDEAAEKINAAQGCKIAAEGKVVMKYEEHGDEPNIIGVYRCSRCKTVIREEHSWYKFCPCCGREIERWE